MNRLIKGLMVCCSLGASMLLAAPAWSVAASDSPGSLAPPAEPAASMTLEELDEIILQGKRLEQRVADAEARFYKRYSLLNGRNDLDVSCEFYWEDNVPSGSWLPGRKRGCVPAFYLQAISLNTPAIASIGGCGSSGSGIMRRTFGPVGGYSGDFSTVQAGHDYAYSSGGFCSFMSRPAVQPIPIAARLAYLNKRSEFLTNLEQVVQSDPQLQTMAGEMEALILEGRDGKRRAVEAARLRRAESKCARPTSPRIVTVCGD
jgi:hypothetical protein